ncbi:TIGR02186 family protein [Tropicimonas sp. IMCC34043]|uniref:TIGR02186 family protein n=1 Tax=Tropicimonas sp. IMCC34043 TaxID=2248760 RepID=UPI000E27B29B|nr:TIGR02186 family protein [Tropicimonas sp. IMCC34043]
MRRLSALLLALFLAAPAAAQDVIADLSQSRVSITARYSGLQILVFGAIRPGPAGVGVPYDVIVTVSGPLEPVTVRRKDRIAGIWINDAAVTIGSAPTLYKIATTAPLDQILSETEDLRHSVSIPRAIRAVGLTAAVKDAPAFTEALIRIRENEGLYQIHEGGVSLQEGTLFRTDIDLPSNLVEGNYHARILLTHNKQVVAEFDDVLGVQKVGMERWIYSLAQEQALAYGVLSLAIAIAAGWGASAAFRYVRGS